MKHKMFSCSERSTLLRPIAPSTMLNKLVLSCLALIGWAQLAVAANIDVQPLLSPAPTWTGCYIGGHVGRSVGHSSSLYSSPASPDLDVNGFFTGGLFIQDFDNRGVSGGGHAGCQQQIGAFLWGLEGDWSSFRKGSDQSFSNGFDEGGGVLFSQTFSQSLSYTSLWSVRGRFGIVFSDVFHLYATVGAGGAKMNYGYSASFSETGAGGCTCASIAYNVRLSPSGLVLGAGAEWKVWSNLIVGAEYLHYDLTSDTVIPFNTVLLNSLIALGDHVHNRNVDVVRVRLGWLFNFGR